MKKAKIRWLDVPQKHDYPAFESYLNLILAPRAAKALAEELESAEITEFAAKDIFRASGLPLLDMSNYHVKKDRARIMDSEELSPLFLVRDKKRGKLIIADGYHRLCAVYTFDEDAMIPCKIA